MLSIESIKKALSTLSQDELEDCYFGLRADEIKYAIGDMANKSHQLFQDPEWVDDNMEELLYPYMEEGPYAGFYDAGELNGTCCISFDPADDASIERAIKTVSCYFGSNVHILCSDSAVSGYDTDEIIIEDAKVIAAFEE